LRREAEKADPNTYTCAFNNVKSECIEKQINVCNNKPPKDMNNNVFWFNILVADIYQAIKKHKEQHNNLQQTCRLWIAMSEWTNSGDEAMLKVSTTIELIAKWGCDVKLIIPYTNFIDEPVMKIIKKYK
jgi:hypothetical protein